MSQPTATTEVSYNPFLPHAAVTSERTRVEQGPRCAKCAKAKWVPGGAGGCDCERYTGNTDAGRVFKSTAHRTVEAMEGIFRVLSAIAASMNVTVPDATGTADEPAAGPVGPMMDDIARSA